MGNSEYQNLNKLHFCRKDISSMQKILSLSKKFEIHIFENYQSEQLKSGLSKIIRELEKSKINELLFYYTGHGVFKEQFYYLPINFTDKQFETTSLSNNELDDMLKSLNTEMVIKIIDACQSGQQYIKESDQMSVKKSLTQHSFKKCYFFFSSMNNQSSMGDDKGSYFTNAIIESIVTHKTDLFDTQMFNPILPIVLMVKMNFKHHFLYINPMQLKFFSVILHPYKNFLKTMISWQIMAKALSKK
ncbi:caspase family protein [Campylobacter jejuni]|nr:caspase family protein [Campylobacter jejuni]